MKVLIPGGEVFDLGTTATTPTVGIVDYSRRVTDDYGVTTVVQRDFARRMSVKVGVPIELVDAVQRKLAALRATAAQWVANDAYACLSVNGFFKDFDLDVATKPLSYCTLTVEGLAETEPFVDTGVEPAPFGQGSTLRLLQPATITDASLVSSNIAETDYPQWAAGTTYALGARVLRGSAHRIYESAAAGNVANDPAAATGKWSDIGPTNRWAMFDQAIGSTTDNAASIAVTLDAPTINAVALLDVTGTSVRVQATGYDKTQPVGAGAITFLDMPAGVTRATVTLTGSGTVSVGTLLVGKLVGLGVTEASPTAGITDYSRKDVDDFGAVTIVERAWAKRMTANALISTAEIDSVFSRLATVRATPSLWIGQAGYDSLTIYGFFKEFSIEAGDTVSKLSLSIEGLSTAGKVTPFAPGGGSVDWPNVGDPDGTKPADNATNGRDPNSPFGSTTVGDFEAKLAEYRAQLAYIDNTTIPTINTAVAGANTRIDAARQAAADAVAAANVKIAAARGDLDKAVSDLAAEVLRARGEDEDLAQRIDAISAGSGYDDTQVRALIQTVDTARADDKRAIASRVDSVVTNYQSADTTTNSRVTQNFTTLSSADMALGSRIDSVISEYKGLDSNTNARITTNIATLSDADRSLGQRIDALVVEGGGYDDSYVRADITTNNFASIDRDAAIGQRIDTVSASFSRGGGNLLGNSDLTTLDGWYMGSTLPGSSPLSLNQAGTGWMVGGIENNLSVYQAGRATGGDGALIQIYSDAFGVTPGGYLQFYVFGASHRALAWASMYFYDDSGAQIGTAGENYGTRIGKGGHNAADWDQVGVKSLRIPDAARTARMILRKYNTLTGEANSYAWWWRPYVGEAREGQMVWNAYSPGNAKPVQVRSDAQIQQAQTAAATAQQAVADLSTSVTTRFSNVNLTLASYDQRITAASSDTQAFAGRASTLEAQMTRAQPSELNSFTTAVNDRLTSINTSVNARIKSSEDVIADLPNRYAAATRTTALEAQVNGENGSRLLARASEQASAIADQKVGVVTQTTQTLRSDLNGTYAQVQQQAGTLAGVDGRTSVYWSVTGTTPDGSTRLQLSKANGSAGLFYVEANMLLAGNLVVDGTITARKFDRTSMSREGASVWQGGITPSLGQTITVPWSLALSQIPALGRFIYEFTAAVVTNAGQTVVGTMNGKPSYLTYVEDSGGLTISARDNQGNVYVPRANASSAVLATTDFVPSWTATIRVGSYDTGWINNGDSYERQVAASYTVSRIDLKVTWVAI